MQSAQFLRRKAAGKYLKEKFGFGSEKTLAKLACVGGGPEFRKVGPAVIYEPAKLDEWALAQIGKPQHSTSASEAACRILASHAAKPAHRSDGGDDGLREIEYGAALEFLNATNRKNFQPQADDSGSFRHTHGWGTRMSGRIDFDRMNAAALALLPVVLSRCLPNGRTIDHEFVALNPRRADKRLGFFKVNLRTGRWADFATGDKGGDPVSLVSFVEDLPQGEAARRVAQMLGIETGGRCHG